MRVREEVMRELVQQWLSKAEDDLGAAELLLSEGRYLNLAGFHAQQAAEKFLKAFLVEHQIEFPKTHNIAELLDLVGRRNQSLAESLRNAADLTPYGAEIRYPGDTPELSAEEAKTAVRLAGDVRKAVLAALA